MTDSPWRAIGITFPFIRDFIAPSGTLGGGDGSSLFLIHGDTVALMNMVMLLDDGIVEVRIRKEHDFENTGIFLIDNASYPFAAQSQRTGSDLVIEIISILENTTKILKSVPFPFESTGNIVKVILTGVDEFEWILTILFKYGFDETKLLSHHIIWNEI